MERRSGVTGKTRREGIGVGKGHEGYESAGNLNVAGYVSTLFRMNSDDGGKSPIYL